VFWIADLMQERFLYVSPAFEHMWGRSRKALYESPETYFAAMHPQDKEHVRAVKAEKGRRGEANELEYRLLHDDGSVRWIRDRSFPIRNEAGEVYRMVGVAEDVTERRRIELTS